MLKCFDGHSTIKLFNNSFIPKTIFKITSYFPLNKKEVRMVTWRKLSALFGRYIFCKYFCSTLGFFWFSMKYFPELFYLSLAPSAIIVWPSQYSPPVFREPVRTQPKMMFQGQTQYCFIQRYFLAYLRQSPQHLDFSFSCPQTLSSKFSSHNHKNSSECCTVFYKETVKHFCNAKWWNS